MLLLVAALVGDIVVGVAAVVVGVIVVFWGGHYRRTLCGKRFRSVPWLAAGPNVEDRMVMTAALSIKLGTPKLWTFVVTW